MIPRARSLLALSSLAAITLVLGARLAMPAAAPAAPAIAPSTLPVPLRLLDPPLPDSLRDRCRPGYTMLRVKIDLRGYVSQPQVIKGFPVSSCVDSATARLIDEMAMSVTRGWVFLPATSGGMAHSMLVDLPVYVPTDTLHVPRHDGVMIGTVVDAVSGRPLPFAHVAVQGSGLLTRADRHGVFRIDHLVRLRAPVSAELVRFLPDTVLAEVIPGWVDTLRLRLAPDPRVAADSAGAKR